MPPGDRLTQNSHFQRNLRGLGLFSSQGPRTTSNPRPQAPEEREELSASLKHFKFREVLGCLQSSEVDLKLGKQD